MTDSSNNFDDALFPYATVVNYQYVGLRVTNCSTLEAAMGIAEIATSGFTNNEDVRVAIFKVDKYGVFSTKPVFTNYVDAVL